MEKPKIRRAVVFENRTKAKNAVKKWNEGSKTIEYKIFEYPKMYGGNGVAVIVRAIRKK